MTRGTFHSTEIETTYTATDGTVVTRTKAPEGWIVYHRDESGCPELHTDGEWYYEPTGWDAGEVYSPGYPTREAAIVACAEWADQQATEEATAEEERRASERVLAEEEQA